jgi:hypothetical protein
VLLAVALAAGCGSASTGGAGGAPPVSSDLRAALWPTGACHSSDLVARPFKPLPGQAISTLMLCPQAIPSQPKRRLTVARSSPQFAPLVRALAAPDEAKSTGLCPQYANVAQLVLATTSTGTTYRVAIPVDGCQHYQRAALAAIARARGLTPRTSLPAAS